MHVIMKSCIETAHTDPRVQNRSGLSLQRRKRRRRRRRRRRKKKRRECRKKGRERVQRGGD